MINDFSNDKAYISTKWLLQLITGRGLRVTHLLKVKHLGTGTVHIVALLSDSRYVCDCMMGINLGIPCRHFFRALIDAKSLQFHIGMIRARFVLSQLSPQKKLIQCHEDGTKIPHLISQKFHRPAWIIFREAVDSTWI